MSYDISLEADLGNGPVAVTSLDWNYTSNMVGAWEAAGVRLRDFEGKKASWCIPLLSKAVQKLTESPDEYKQFEPENGWGSIDTLTIALYKLLQGLREAPDATVRVWY